MMPGDPYIFAPTDPGTWIRSVDGTWRRAPDDPRYAPVVVPPAVLDAAERDPGLVRRIDEAVTRKLEESHERLVAHLKERSPRRASWSPPDYASIKKSPDSSGFAYPVANDPNAPRPGEPTCSRCSVRLMFSARERGDGLCGPCSRAPCGHTESVAEIAVGIALHGRWRVYFNKHGRVDLPWCIAPDSGGWEIAVPSVLITTDATTAYQPKATPDDEDGRPSAWIAVEGVLTVAGGRASIAASAAPEVQAP